MKPFLKYHYLLTLVMSVLLSITIYSQNLDSYKYNGSLNPAENAVTTDFQSTDIQTTGMIFTATESAMGIYLKSQFQKLITQLPRAQLISLTI